MKWAKATIVGVAVCAALFLLLFPFFAKPARGNDATLLGIDEQPIPNKEVVVRSSTGEVLGRVRTNAQGRFRFPVAARGKTPPKVDGFTLVRTMGHSGGNPSRSYIYGAAALSRIVVNDPDGRQVPVRVSVRSEPNGTVDVFGSGARRLIPAGARIDIAPQAMDRRIAGVKREVQNGSVLYTVTLRKPKDENERQEAWTSPYPGLRSARKNSAPNPV